METLSAALTPGAILQLGTAYWASRTLLSAVELGVFTELAKGPLSLGDLTRRIGIHQRSARDFFDALVALKMLERDGAEYRNTPECDLFLDRAKSSYVGGILEMGSFRLYGHWGKLTEALRTGEPQGEARGGEAESFTALYSDPARLRNFLGAMTGVSMGAGKAMAEKFPWKDYKTYCDIGGAQGAVTVQIALAHPHLSGGNFDLPEVKPVFEEYVRAFKLESRLNFQAGNFMKEGLPSADVLVMGHILHDWGLDTKRMLLRKAYDALPAGGCLIVHEALIDDDRRKNAFGLLMSLNMLIETEGGFDFTGADCMGWMKEVGFSKVRIEPLIGPDSMAIATK